MKTAIFKYISFLASIFVLTMTNGYSLSKAVWAPLLDEAAIGNTYCPLVNGVTICPSGPDITQHPDFKLGQSAATREGIVDNALMAAYKKGVRTVDIYYYAGPSTPYVPPTDVNARTSQEAYRQGMIEQGDIWIRRINHLNDQTSVVGSDYMKVRIRVSAIKQFLSGVLYRSDRNKYQSHETIPNAAIMSTAGTVLGSDPALLDLSNPVIRTDISDYTAMVLNGLFPRLSSRTAVEEVTLVLDGAGESSSWPSTDGTITYFSNSQYPIHGTLAQKIAHYQLKQAALRSTYQAFADRVHGFTYNGVNKSLKAAVFYQTWAFDSKLRGAFDLTSLLKGLNIDYLHHTNTPVSFDQSLRFTAYSASVSRYLGKPFDDEFTWPWTGSVNPINLNAMDPANADLFYFQGAAGFLYGGAGFTYANWVTRSFTKPPADTHWQNLLGLQNPWNDTHLTRAGSAGVAAGLFTYAPWPAAKKAIYISTLGRIDCEENLTCYGWAPGAYMGWFGQFNLNYVGERIDIITDQMIKDTDPFVFLNKYDVVYVPYQTSKYIDADVFTKLNAFWANSPSKVWVASSPTSTANAGFGSLIGQTNHTMHSF